MSKWMNDTNDAEDEMEQRGRAQSSDHNLCSDTKMMPDRRTTPVSIRATRGNLGQGWV